MKFRSARHTNNLEPLIAFYTQILNLDVLGSFKDHDGYDGVFFGKRNQDWHLEFTKSSTLVKQIYNPDDILVFYPDNINEYDEIIRRIIKYGIEPIIPVNPYWRDHGVMIKDPDGYHVVISKENVN